MLGLVFFFHEEAADLALNIPTFNAVVVNHVRQAVYRDADFLYVRKDVFSESLAPAAYGSTNTNRRALGVDYHVYSLVRLFFERVDYITGHVVVGELFAAHLSAFCHFSKRFSPPVWIRTIANHFINKLDVGQLVFQLGCVRASDHIFGGCKSHLNTKSL